MFPGIGRQARENAGLAPGTLPTLLEQIELQHLDIGSVIHGPEQRD